MWRIINDMMDLLYLCFNIQHHSNYITNIFIMKRNIGKYWELRSYNILMIDNLNDILCTASLLILYVLYI